MKPKVLLALLSISFSSLAFSESRKLIVENITASPCDDCIIVSWTVPESETRYIDRLFVYRATKPIATYGDISETEPIAELSENSCSYTDRDVSVHEYYYAVISSVCTRKKKSYGGEELYFDEELDTQEPKTDGTLEKIILPGVNATVSGTKSNEFNSPNKITIREKHEEPKEYKDSLRAQPLPYMNILNDRDIPQKHDIKPSTRKKISSLIHKKNRIDASPLQVHIFEDDLISPEGGDDYFLFEILRDSFIKKRYDESIKKLEEFLFQNRTESTTSRAMFYLGESYYYTGDFPNALTYFLALEDKFPELSRKWSESSLDLYKIK